jgi:hypothetical protein
MNIGKEIFSVSEGEKRKDSHYLRIDKAWLQRAAGLSRHALIVGLLAWDRVGWWRRTEPRQRDPDGVTLNASRIERQWPITRESVTAGLRHLERAGLVLVTRRPGRAARVRVLLRGGRQDREPSAEIRRESR